jgi:hypothetical protein
MVEESTHKVLGVSGWVSVLAVFEILFDDVRKVGILQQSSAETIEG